MFQMPLHPTLVRSRGAICTWAADRARPLRPEDARLVSIAPKAASEPREAGGGVDPVERGRVEPVSPELFDRRSDQVVSVLELRRERQAGPAECG